MFQALRGVVQVDQGFIQSDAPSDSWAEGVIVHFDPALISLETLAEVHLRTHSATGTYSPEGRYRSAVYGFDANQRCRAETRVALFALETNAPARTLVLAFVGFKPSDTRYRNYYRSDPSRPFCKRYIDPKLDYLRNNFAAIMLPDAAGSDG